MLFGGLKVYVASVAPPHALFCRPLGLLLGLLALTQEALRSSFCGAAQRQAGQSPLLPSSQ